MKTKMKNLVSLTAGLLFTIGCGNQNASVEISATAQHNLKLLPAESNLVLFCDFNKINQTPFARQIVQEFNEQIREQTDEDFESFQEATGLDLQKDFHNILIGSTLSNRRSEQKTFAIINGEFDERRIVAYIREKAEEEHRDIPWIEERIADKTVYVTTKSRTDFAVCFADANTLYLGPKPWLSAILSGSIKESLQERPEYLETLIKHVKYGDQLWMALDAKTITAQSSSFASKLRRNMPAFERVESVVFSAKANSEFDFNGLLFCDTKESGEVMVDLMRGALAAAKLAVSNERTKVDELNKIEVFQEGKIAVLQGELTGEFFRTLQENRLYRRNEF